MTELGQKEPDDTHGRLPERRVEAPSMLWWMLAIVAVLAFSALAFWLGRVS